MAYTPNALQNLWSNLAAQYVDYAETSIGQYTHYEGQFYKFTLATKNYSTSLIYSTNDYCIHDDSATSTPDKHYYKCNTAIVIPEAWTAAHWTQVTEDAWIAATATSVPVSDQIGGKIDASSIVHVLETPYPMLKNTIFSNNDKIYKTNIAIIGYIAASSYVAGDYITYGNPMVGVYYYRANKATSGTFNIADWDIRTMDEMIADCCTETSIGYEYLNQITWNPEVSPEYEYSWDPNKGYYYVSYYGNLYCVGSEVYRYDSTSTYVVGQYVTYAASGSTYKFYCCNTAITTPEAFDATKWTEKSTDEFVNTCLYHTTIGDELGCKFDYWNTADTLYGGNSYSPTGYYSSKKYVGYNCGVYKCSKEIFPYYTWKSYAVGDYCTLSDNNFYKCINATSGTWVAADWEKITSSAIVIEDCFTSTTIMDEIPNVEQPWATFVIKNEDTLLQYLRNDLDKGQNYNRVEVRNGPYSITITDPSTQLIAANCEILRGNNQHIQISLEAPTDKIILSAHKIENLQLTLTANYTGTTTDFVYPLGSYSLSDTQLTVEDSFIKIYSKDGIKFNGTLTDGSSGSSEIIHYHNSQVSVVADNNTDDSEVNIEMNQVYENCIVGTSLIKSTSSTTTSHTLYGINSRIIHSDVTDSTVTGPSGYFKFAGPVYDSHIYLEGNYNTYYGFANNATGNIVEAVILAGISGGSVTGYAVTFPDSTVAQYYHISNNSFINANDGTTTDPHCVIHSFSSSTNYPQMHHNNMIAHKDSHLGFVVDWTDNSSGDFLTAISAAPAFSTTSTYAVGDTVTYNNATYRCKVAVTTAGTWSDTNWAAIDMVSEKLAELVAISSALGLTRTVTYDTTTSKFVYSYSLNP